jgi:hypothetical protein
MAQGTATRAAAETAAELAQHTISDNITGFFAALAEFSQVEIPTSANDADASDDKEVHHDR